MYRTFALILAHMVVTTTMAQPGLEILNSPRDERFTNTSLACTNSAAVFLVLRLHFFLGGGQISGQIFNVKIHGMIFKVPQKIESNETLVDFLQPR